MSSTATEISVEDARRRMPSLRLIDDDGVREETTRLTADAPAYFWKVPASRRGYHNPLCREETGLWVHTLMLSTVVEELGESRRELGEVTEEDLDHAHAAAVLHDQRKHGEPGDPSETSTSDHDLHMAEVIREESDLPEAVASAVETHMGPWYDGPEPTTPVERLVHDADMVASNASITAKVPGPIPEEFAHLDVEEVDLR